MTADTDPILSNLMTNDTLLKLFMAHEATSPFKTPMDYGDESYNCSDFMVRSYLCSRAVNSIMHTYIFNFFMGLNIRVPYKK
jgi:hypothetical protein